MLILCWLYYVDVYMSTAMNLTGMEIGALFINRTDVLPQIPNWFTDATPWFTSSKYSAPTIDWLLPTITQSRLGYPMCLCCFLVMDYPSFHGSFHLSPRWTKWPPFCQTTISNAFSWMKTSNGSWCMGIKGEMSGTVCVTFTWYMYIYMSCL